MVLTPTSRKFGKRLARGSSVSVAVECVKDKRTQKHVVAALGQVIRSEITKLCSSKVNSIQNFIDPKSLQSFSWDTIIGEAAEHAPSLVQLLMECMKKNIRKRKTSQPSQKSIVGMCISLFCKHRNQKMNLVQKVLCLVLYAGHSAKQVRR